MLKPICVQCCRFFRPAKNGFYFVEGMQKPGVVKAARGTAEPEKWTPCKLWSGDKWRCDGCGTEIVAGVGLSPIKERHHPDFQETIEAFNALQLQVNDC
jgi:hypothetical protein